MSKNLLFFIVGNALLFALTYFTRKKRRLNNAVLSCTTIFLVLSIVETAYRNFFRPEPPILETAKNVLSFKPDSLLGQQISRTGIFTSVKLGRDGRIIRRTTYTIVADSTGPYVFDHRIGYSALGPRVGYPALGPRAGHSALMLRAGRSALGPAACHSQPGPKNPEAVFLGCSFTFGEGVNDSETLPYKAGVYANIPTLDMGSPGYGIHQVYKLFLDKYASTDNRNRVFVYTMIADHVLRASGLYDFSAGPAFKLIGDSLEYAGQVPNVSYKAAWYASFFGCYSFIKDGIIHMQEAYRAKRVPADAYQKAYWMIRHMDRDAKATGGHFLLLYWDFLSSDGDPNRYYRGLLESELEQLRKDGVKIVRISDILDSQDQRYYIPLDGHPNAMAYDTVARYLAERVNISR